jgi:hypothetical protein
MSRPTCIGVAADVTDWSDDESSFSILLASKDNPLVDFVELPEKYSDLSFCNILCGCIQGALEMVFSLVASASGNIITALAAHR